MTPRRTRTAGRRASGANAKRERSISAGRIHFARGCEISPKGPIKGRSPFMGTAGVHIAELIKTMLEKKASGVELAQMERGVGT